MQLKRGLLLQLQHLLFVQLQLFGHIAHDDANSAVNGAQVNDFPTAVQGTLSADRSATVLRIVVTEGGVECGIEGELVFVSRLDLSVYGDGQFARNINDDIPAARLKFALGGLFSGSDEPGGDAAGAGGRSNGAIDFREVDAAAASFEIGRAGNAHDVNAAAAILGFDEAGRLANLDLAADGFGDEFAIGMLHGNVAAAGRKMRRTVDGLSVDVTTIGMEIGAAGNGSGGDMAAAGNGKEVACDILDGEVASGGFEVGRAANIAGDDRSPGSDQGNAAVNVLRFDIPSACNYIYVVVPGNVQFDGDPEAAARLMGEGAAAEIDAIGSFMGADGEIAKQPMSVFFGRVHFEADVVIDFASVGGFNDDVAEIEVEAEPLAIVRENGAAHLAIEERAVG